MPIHIPVNDPQSVGVAYKNMVLIIRTAIADVTVAKAHLPFPLFVRLGGQLQKPTSFLQQDSLLV